MTHTLRCCAISEEVLQSGPFDGLCANAWLLFAVFVRGPFRILHKGRVNHQLAHNALFKMREIFR